MTPFRRNILKRRFGRLWNEWGMTLEEFEGFVAILCFVISNVI